MMNYKDKEKIYLKVAIMFIVIVLIFLFSYHYFVNSSKNFVTIKILFPIAENISVGSPVSIYGVEIGSVKRIEIKKEGVLLFCKVSLPFKISQNSKFIISPKNLMGENKIEIVPSDKGMPITDFNQTFKGYSSFSLANLFNDLNTFSQHINSLLSKDTMTKLKTIIENSNNALENLYNISKDEKIPRIIYNLDKTITDLDNILAENSPEIKKLIENGNLNLENISKVFSLTQELLDNLINISQTAKETDNNLNRFIKDKELYDKLIKNSTKLDSLLDDIKKNPKRYSHL